MQKGIVIRTQSAIINLTNNKAPKKGKVQKMTTYNNIPFTTDEKALNEYFKEFDKELKELTNFFEKEREWLKTIKE